ncbi:MAG: hypothetical protein VX668_12765, partial [Planctomycetota bacterium]|nr:hypothetical protein [Planctomycetota bacterium]
SRKVSQTAATFRQAHLEGQFLNRSQWSGACSAEVALRESSEIGEPARLGSLVESSAFRRRAE